MTESQNVVILKEAGAAMPIQNICHKYGKGNSTFYSWREKYGGMEAPNVHRLKMLEEKNRRLKQIYGKSTTVAAYKRTRKITLQ